MKKLILTSALALLSLSSMAQAQCRGTTKSGKQCSKTTKSTSGYCKLHDPAIVHCAATTKAGKQCSKLPSKNSKYCSMHKQ